MDDLAFTLGVGRDALNLVWTFFLHHEHLPFKFITKKEKVAASKGLVAGPMKFIMRDNTTVCCFSDLDDNNPIPLITMVRQVDFNETR